MRGGRRVAKGASFPDEERQDYSRRFSRRSSCSGPLFACSFFKQSSPVHGPEEGLWLMRGLSTIPEARRSSLASEKVTINNTVVLSGCDFIMSFT